MELNGIEFEEHKEPIRCIRCGGTMLPMYRHVVSNNSIQARCTMCGAFIQNMKHYVDKIDIVENPTAKQLLFIKSFYNSNQMPKSKKRASELIYVLNKVREDYELR